MIKGIIMGVLLAAVVRPADVEKLWSEAKIAFEAYRFDKAIELIDTYTSNARHDTAKDGECAALRIRAEKAAEMMGSVEEVIILDSVKTVKSKMLEVLDIQRETGFLKNRKDGGVVFTTGRGDRSIMSEKNDDQFDLYLTYSDGERRKLSEMVNTTMNENYPFELTDGATLYFASDGHGSIGGYDIFMTRYNNETSEYSEPMHVGMPFNSIYNDYMMVIDELTNIGWFATDRYQIGDTVVIYKFKATDSKTILPQEVEEGVRVATAQMKRYRVGYDESKSKTKDVRQEVEIESFKFVINDTLIYTSEDQFKDSMSIKKYHEIKETENAIKLRSIVVEGKKREYQTSDNKEDRALLKKEILEDEEFINESRSKIVTLTKEIRKIEYLKNL